MKADRMAVLKATVARQEVFLARVEAEISEMAGWYVEDGLSVRSARQKAVRNHPYYVLRRWREARKAKMLASSIPARLFGERAKNAG